MRKPFFRKQTKSWYVKDAAGKWIRLRKDRDEAFAAWHAMESSGEVDRKPGEMTVGYLIGMFPDWTKANRAPASHDWYCGYLAGSEIVTVFPMPSTSLALNPAPHP
jgi:hypothetical protein